MTPPPATTPADFGAALKRAREECGTALETIANRTKISLRTLTALEAGEFARLPDRVFGRMFLRQYLETMGLSSDDWLPGFEAAWQTFAEASHPGIAVPALPIRRRHFGAWAVGSALVAAGLAAVLLTAERGQESPPPVLPPVATPPTPAPVRSANPVPPPAVATPPVEIQPPPTREAPAGTAAGVLVVRTDARPCWVEVRVAGEKATSRLLARSSTWEVPAGGRDVDLVVGDAGAVTIEYLGGVRRPVGAAGAVARVHLDGSPAVAPVR